MATIFQWGKPKQETKALEVTEEQIKLLTDNGWFRIDIDLWRNQFTTEELPTNQALNLCSADTEVTAFDLEVLAEDKRQEVKASKLHLNSQHEAQLRQQFGVLTGKAGSGKTTTLKLMSELDPKYIELGATTGIAAINCGGRTVHSILRYYNTASLEIAYHNGRLHERLRKVRARKKKLGIDEASMLPAQQLDIIYSGIQDINMDKDYNGEPLGLLLIGDFCQLPPVKKPPENSEYCFKAACWEDFESNIIKLDKIWRQDNPDFIAAINLMREGNGKEAVKYLKACGVRFASKLIEKFEGTTLIPKNDQVDIYNAKRLAENSNPTIRVHPLRRGTQAKEWDKEIPIEQRFKIGAYVMILRNDFENWTYVNGDCGEIVDFNSKSEIFSIKLKRTNEVVDIGTVKQTNLQDEQPNESEFNSMFYPKLDPVTGQWCVGYIEYHPLRLAYASTIHKSQGLSLDLLQIDSTPSFYKYPSMAYVSVSRARTPEGLIIVGSESDFASKINTSPEVRRFI